MVHRWEWGNCVCRKRNVLRLTALGVAFGLVMLEDGASGNLFRALAIFSGSFRAREDVLVLPLLLAAYAPRMFVSRRKCPPALCWIAQAISCIALNKTHSTSVG